MKSWIENLWPSASRPVIGVIHAPALPGAPQYCGDVESVRDRVVRDAENLLEGGVDGLLLENYGDSPFYPGRVPAATATHMTALAFEIRRRFDIPLGINVLRNDGRTALTIAQATVAHFIRVNVLGGARVTDQGVVSGIAHDLLRDRKSLGALHVKILADVNVKHSVPIGRVKPETEASDLIERCGADALIVTGPATGYEPEEGELQRVRKAVGDLPVFVGSGVTPSSADLYRNLADGFIIGSYFKVDGKAGNRVDVKRVRTLMEALR